MTLTESLNLVVPMRLDEKGAPSITAFHTPISREVFDVNYRIIAGTKASLWSKGIAYAADSGPRIAALELREQARIWAAERGQFTSEGAPRDDAAVALLAEIKRLTMVLVAGPNGWEQVPVDFAVQRGAIDAEDWREAESNLVFFTCGYAMATRAERTKIAKATAGVLGSAITSLLLPEYIASLPTSTVPKPIAPAPSSIPS